MSGADLLLVVLVVGVATFLARGSHLLVGVLLVVTALALSAILFLPTGMLVEWIGRGWMDRMYGWTRGTPWDPPEWIHLLAFLWLGFLLWMTRPATRSWWGLALIVVLAGGAELAQELARGRTPNLEDVILNVVGALLGVAMGIACRTGFTWSRKLARKS